MAIQVSTEQALQIGAKVFSKAAADGAFRALALRDGTAAVEQVLGKTLPDGMKIRFVENEGAFLTLGLPPARTSSELSDTELESVAGGRGDGGGGTALSATVALNPNVPR